MVAPVGLVVLLLAAEPGPAATAAPTDSGTAETSRAGATGASSVTGPEEPQRRRARATVRIATYNVATTLRTRRAVRDVRRLAGRVHILALQEMSNPRRRARVRSALVSCGRCPFDAYLPGSAGPGSNPILVRSRRFRVVAAGSRQVTKRTWVGPRGAGPSTIAAKHVSYVRLRDRRTGRFVVVLNNHAVASVQAPGGEPNRRLRKRVRLYRQHMRGLQQLVTRFRDRNQVFVTGDLNVNYRVDRRVGARLFPYHRLGRLGMRASYDPLGMPATGTHRLRSGDDRRLIDYVYYLRQRSVRPVRQRILRGYASDHRPLVVHFRVSGRR
jgi:endonuclease/exonuclease/phosphatase family metal-dependent hydrolase